MMMKKKEHTESPPNQPFKSIYDDHSNLPTLDQPRQTAKPSQSTSLTAHLTMHTYATAAEDCTNALLIRAFRLKHSFTSITAALAPVPQTNERHLRAYRGDGGEHTVRNRKVLLRVSVQGAVGTGPGYGYVLILATMGNVDGLVWRFEKRWPVLADTHVRFKERVSGFAET
jgi:organizing structure protein 2